MKRKEEHIRGFAHRMTYEEYQELVEMMGGSGNE